MFLKNTSCINSETASQVTDQVIAVQEVAKLAKTALGKSTLLQSQNNVNHLQKYLSLKIQVNINVLSMFTFYYRQEKTIFTYFHRIPLAEN